MTDLPPPSDRAGALLREHGWGAWLEAHQVFDRHVVGLFEALPRPLEALVRTLWFRRQLSAHMALEEEQVLALCDDDFASCIANTRRDHELIRGGLKKLEEAALSRLGGRIDAELLSRALVELDQLLEHHDDRETQQLYAPLQTRLSDADQRALLQAFSRVPLCEPLAQAQLTQPAAVSTTCSSRSSRVSEPAVDALR